MKGKSCIPENLVKPAAGVAETERMMRTGMPANSIRARGPATAPQCDAGYMTATSSLSQPAISSCTAGRTIYGLTASRMRSACCLRGSGTSAPAPLRQHARAYAYAYQGLRALASLSMARSERCPKLEKSDTSRDGGKNGGLINGSLRRAPSTISREATHGTSIQEC